MVPVGICPGFSQFERRSVCSFVLVMVMVLVLVLVLVRVALEIGFGVVCGDAGVLFGDLVMRLG
jgi:hypothetical protein